MSKTPEEMAEEYIAKTWDGKAKGVPVEYCRKDFLAGYKAAQEEEATKDQKIAELWCESIKNMLPSVHEVVLFPGNSTKANEADKARDAEIIAKMDAATKKAKSNFTNNSNGWISVKDRLPESGVGWTMVYGCILSRWSVQPGFYDRQRKEWLSRFFNGYEDEEGYAPLEGVTHWQPLPEPPKEEK